MQFLHCCLIKVRLKCIVEMGARKHFWFVHRYPTNKWAKLGTFHARDERTVQSFPLDEHLYAKYVKVCEEGPLVLNPLCYQVKSHDFQENHYARGS